MTSSSLDDQLASLDAALLARLKAAGFDRERFLTLAASLREGDAAGRRRTRNIVRGDVAPPRPSDVARLPAAGSAEHSRLVARGEAALRAGEVAFCLMAGGMATRMGGIVKALARVWDGHTFLGLRLGENRSASARCGRAIPLWLMTSHATAEAIADNLREVHAPPHVATFMQDVSLRLTPRGDLYRDERGEPSVYATGHGDLVDALRRSRLLERFLDAGGRYVWITNVDNLGATIDPAVLGHFLEETERGADVLTEVCRKEGDRGGIPVYAGGKLQVLEEFRLPDGFDAATVPVFNTNTFLVRAEPLLRAPLTWTFFEVEKTVSGAKVVQFERLLQEITAQLATAYVEIPRDGSVSRFLPVKDDEELARRRETIEAVARARGMV